MAELERPTIQLADASGPHPLADESNYEFLQKRNIHDKNVF